MAASNQPKRSDQLMTYKPTTMGALVGIRGTLECRNAAGEVIKTIEMNGEIPLSRLGLTVEQAQTLVEQTKERQDGTDRSE